MIIVQTVLLQLSIKTIKKRYFLDFKVNLYLI